VADVPQKSFPKDSFLNLVLRLRFANAPRDHSPQSLRYFIFSTFFWTDDLQIPESPEEFMYVFFPAWNSRRGNRVADMPINPSVFRLAFLFPPDICWLSRNYYTLYGPIATSCVCPFDVSFRRALMNHLPGYQVYPPYLPIHRLFTRHRWPMLALFKLAKTFSTWIRRVNEEREKDPVPPFPQSPSPSVLLSPFLLRIRSLFGVPGRRPFAASGRQSSSFLFEPLLRSPSYSTAFLPFFAPAYALRPRVLDGSQTLRTVDHWTCRLTFPPLIPALSVMTFILVRVLLFQPFQSLALASSSSLKA